MKPSGFDWRWQLFLHFMRMGRRALLLRNPRLIGKWLREDRHSIMARKLFSLGHFAGAMKHARSHLAVHPEDEAIRIVAVCSAIETRDYESADRHLALLDDFGASPAQRRQLPFYRYAISQAGQETRTQGALEELDAVFLEMGCRTVRLGEYAGAGAFDALTARAHEASAEAVQYRPLTEGPLVSVVVTAFNAEDVIATAVASILEQSYKSLELIVVDDCSSDRTMKVLRELARSDRRMRVVAKPTNDGTYVSKNMGIKAATGHYVALQDSDDWSHPERLGKSIAILEARPDIVALTTEWLRMTTQGDIVIQSTTKCAYRSCISLVFRREGVTSRAGYFDSVRAEGDAEYIERIKTIFGEPAVLELPWLLAFGRIRSGAISQHAKVGMIRGRARPARAAYRRAYKEWHERVAQGNDGYMAFPLNKRPFPAPHAMLSGGKHGKAPGTRSG